MFAKSLIASLATSICLVAGSAQAITLDFNTYGNGVDLTGLDLGGVIFTRGTTTIITERGPSGSRAIRGAGFNNPNYFRGDFTRLVSDVSVDLGDFGGDADTLRLWAYDSLGGLLGSDSRGLAADRSLSLTLSVAAPDISYVLFGTSSTAFFPNSVYADNFTFTVSQVPLPATGAMLMLGLGALGLHRRATRKQTT